MRLEQKIKSLEDRKAEIHASLLEKMAVVEEIAADDEAYTVWEKEYSDLEAEMNKAVDEIAALKERREEAMARAKRVDDLIAEEKAINTDIEGKAPVNAPATLKTGKKLYEGDLVIRSAKASIIAKMNGASPVDVASALYPNDPRIAAVVRAPVAVPASTTVNLGDELVLEQQAQGEMIDLLRNELVYPKIPGMRVLPLDARKGSIRIPRQTGAVSANWVGELNSIPVSNPSLDHITINPYKVATISMASRELLERSEPAYEVMLRDQVIRALAETIDRTFIDDVAAGVASPAGILNGLVASAGAGTLPAAPTAAQVITYINALKMDLMNANITGPYVWIMTPSTMMGLASLRSAIDTPLFPEISAGQLQGFPIVSTNNVPTALTVSGSKPIILAKAQEIFFGLGRGIMLETSNSAYIQSDSAPATPPTGGVSLWQQDAWAIRAITETTFARRRDAAIAWAPTLL